MPAYNFKAQFAPAVKAGTKLSTIRRRAAKVGTTAYLYTGMRTKACQKLGQGTITKCENIIIGQTADGKPFAKLQGQLLSDNKLLEMAKLDGFKTAELMIDWFAYTYDHLQEDLRGGFVVFAGYLTTWELSK